MKYDTCVSLGTWCGVAEQLKHNCPSRHRSGFFDWLFTPFASIGKLVRDDFTDVFNINNFSNRNGYTVDDVKYGISYHHDFTRKDDVITSGAIDAEYDGLKSKYAHKVAKWFETVNSGKYVLYVIGFTKNLGLRPEGPSKTSCQSLFLAYPVKADTH